MGICMKDYDVIGFDMDHTIVKYKLPNLYKLCYESIVKHLTEIGYPKDIFRDYWDGQALYCQKGLVYDKLRGNMLKIGSEKQILRAFHGTKRLSEKEISDIYKDSECLQSLKHLPFIRGETSEEITKNFNVFGDFFTTATIYLLMEMVDAIDENKLNKTYSQVHGDMYDGYSNMYRREAFQSHTGYFFPEIKENPEKMLHKCSPGMLRWLKQLRSEGIKVLLITSSNVDFCEALMNYSIGKDWMSYFDSVVTYARKPGFWTCSDRHFHKIKNHMEGDVTSLLEKRSIYAIGCWQKYQPFLQKISGKEIPRCLYIGDSLVDDMYVPKLFKCSDTLGIIEEINEDASELWGDFLDHSEQNESLWWHVAKTSCQAITDSVETLASFPVDCDFKHFVIKP